MDDARGCERGLPAWLLGRISSHTTWLDQWSSVIRCEVQAVSLTARTLLSRAKPPSSLLLRLQSRRTILCGMGGPKDSYSTSLPICCFQLHAAKMLSCLMCYWALSKAWDMSQSLRSSMRRPEDLSESLGIQAKCGGTC